MAAALEAAAAERMVIFRAVVDCLDPSPFPLSSRSFAGWKQAASCAVAFAQQNAADYGGDAAPNRGVRTLGWRRRRDARHPAIKH